MLSFSLGFAQSPLQTGTWEKISLTESGIYKITYEDLLSWGFSNISSVSIYGNGAGELSTINTTELPDTLHEIAIYIEKGSDNIFNSGDYILFYGQSPHIWKYSNGNFSHKSHTYSDKNYYFITCNQHSPKEISTKKNPQTSATQNVTSYDDLYFYESNEMNYIRSGRNFMETISTSKSISFSVPNCIQTEDAILTISAAARHTSSTTINVSCNNTTVGSLSYSATSTQKPYAYLKTKSFKFTPTNSTITTNIVLNFSGANSRGILDYCELQCRSKLQISNNEQLTFRDTKSISENSVSSFSISTNTNQTVWNITDPENPCIIQTNFANNALTFSAETNQLEEYIAFSSKYKTVTFEKDIENQNILATTDADMIIIANDVVKEYAQQIANLHTEKDKFTCYVVNQESICNEFSSGRKDVSAIRNYLRYLYKKGNKKLQYVLLFGDGNYNNKSIELNDFQIFTFESNESLHEDYSYCSDDYFALLDDNKGVNEDTFIGENDIAIGRFAVSTLEEAVQVTYKTIQYSTNSKYRGDWQNYLCFLADDADENQTIHMTDADLLCTTINKYFPQFNFDKIYADAYEETKTSAGQRYPEVISAISDRIQKGCLIFNYSGHGNENRMMAEYSVDATTITSWNNSQRLPLFIGAACNIAHFDQDWTSLGERIVAQENGGGIGIISATRYSYASSNYTFCNNIYNVIFTLDSLNQIRTIGETLKIAKANTTNDFYQNKRVYILLGDPALRLAIPYYSIEIDSINGKKVSTEADTIKALSTMKVTGHIKTITEELAEDYNGTLYIKLFDKQQSITTLGNDGNDTFTYDSYTNVLFQGLASVTNGRFSFSANIPEDIFYYDGNGKLSLFATNDTIQATGAYYNILINGSESSEDDDFTGPNVSLFVNDTTFKNGSLTNQNPTILIYVTDTSGINISNASIGHNIQLTIDGNEENQIILNDFYYNDLNTFTSGSLQYQLKDLEDGEHTITLTIWDSYNNPTEKTLKLYVSNSQDVTIKNLYNYPNPMKDLTTFHFEHNQANYESHIVITIFDTYGNIVTKILGTRAENSFSDNSFQWDGKSFGGVQMHSGIYPYTIEIQTSNGKKLHGEQKILLVR